MVRTWWSAPNRTAGWDAPTTSGTTYAVGAQPARLSPKRTRYRGESRCSACDAEMEWWILADRGRVVAIQQVSQTALQDAQVKRRIIDDGAEPASSKSPEEFAAFVRNEVVKWGKVVKAAGIAAH